MQYLEYKLKLSTKASLAGGFSALILSTTVTLAKEPLTIVITGSRTAQTVDETLAPVTVISRQQIASHPGSTVSDVLASTPGLNIASNGGKGSEQSIFLRGTESDHVLVLVDGLRVSSATTGTASITDIPLDQIDRIEVVRGPRSSLYGSEAIGGVIQLFTRKPTTGSREFLSVSAGSHSSYGLNGGFSGRSDKAWFNANVSTFSTEGFDACRGKPFPNGRGCFADDPDADGYENQSVSFSGGVQLGAHATASLNLLQANSDLDFDGSLEDRKEASNQLLSAKLEAALNERWDVTLIAGKSKDHADNFKGNVFSSRFNTDRSQFTLQNDIRIGQVGTLTIGADHYSDKVSGTTEYEITRRDNTGLFGQYLGQYGATGVQISVRSDDNEQFGSQTTGGISVGRDFANGLRWTAAWGSAFKAPSFNELYFPGFGNAELGAETADSFDVGLSGRSANTRFSAHLFETTVDNLISFDAKANKPVNIGEARITGIELNVGTQLAGWNLDLGLTVQQPKNRGEGDNQNNILARRAQNLANLQLNRQWGKLNVGVDIHSQGHSFDDLANTKRLDGFTTVDLNLDYALTQQWSVNLAINNLFDEAYETAQYFNQDGLNGMLLLRYSPE